MATEKTVTGYIDAYEGCDMISWVMANGGFQFPGYYGSVRSMTNVRDTAIIITDIGIFRAKPYPGTGFCIEFLHPL
jgi:hypothetical protein